MPLLNLSVSQLLWVFVATNISAKLRPNRPFLRWLVWNGLTCYQVPSNEELRKLQYSDKDCGDSKRSQSKNNPRNKQNDQSFSSKSSRTANQFKIRSSDLVKLSLKKIDIDSKVLSSVPYGDDLEWVVDFALMSIISFLLTQLLFYLSPRSHEYNFSLVWVFLVVFISLILLSQFTTIYFRNEVSIGERSVCIVSGCIFLLITMLVLSIDKNHIELKLDESLKMLGQGFKSLKPNKDALLGPDEIEQPPELPNPIKPLQVIAIKLVIAIICSWVGIIFTFPGLRFGQLHESFLSEITTSTTQKIIYNFNYISPMIVTCLWIPVISRNVLKKQEYYKVDDEGYDLFRSYLVIFINLVRFLLVPKYVLVFLHSCGCRINRIRFKGGMTTNKEIQVTVAFVNNYANVVCMQYILPTFICLFTSIMFATLTYYSSHGQLDYKLSDHPSNRLSSFRTLLGDDHSVLIESAEEILLKIRCLILSEFTKNMVGFANWWFHFAWFTTTISGTLYHIYFTH